MANTLRFKRGLLAGLPSAAVGEPLFTTDTFDLYIGTASGTQKYQKYIASGTTSQLLRGDGSLLTMPIVLTSPSNGQVLKFNGTNWVNDSDAGITGSGTTNYLPKFTGATTLGNSNLQSDANGNLGFQSTPNASALANTLISVRDGSLISSAGTYIHFLTNSYYSTDWKYNASSLATRYSQEIGSHIWYTAPSGMANATITWTQTARITAGGNFIINNSSTDNGLRFQVTGDGFFSGSVGVGNSSMFTKFNVRHSNATVYSPTNSATWLSGINLYNDSTAALNISNLISFYGSSNVNSVFGVVQNASGVGDFIFSGYNGSTFGELMRLTGAGNLGLGVTPSAWNSGVRAMQVGLASSIASRTGGSGLYIGDNYYFSTDPSTGPSTAIYLYSAAAATYRIASGSHIWYNAPSGTANAAITWTTAMTLDASGNLFIGATSGSNTAGFTNRLYLESNVPSITLSNTGTNTGKYTIGVTNGNFGVWNNGTSSYPLYIFSDNNVGIGTGSTNAGYKLDVNGTGRFTSGLTSSTAFQQIAHYFYNGGGTNDIFASTLGNGAGSGNFAIVNTVGGARIGLLASSTGSIRMGNNTQTAASATDFVLNLSTGNISINSGTDAGYKLDVNGTMRVSGASSIATSSGNVGIGTTTAASKLHTIGGDIFLGLDWASANYDGSTIRNFRIASNGGNSGYITQAAYNSAATANTTFFRNYVNAATTGAWVVEVGVGNFNTNNGLPSSYSEVFRIAQTGAATFSSSVTATSALISNYRLELPNMNIGYWDSTNNRFESTTRPMFFTSYGSGNNIYFGFDGSYGAMTLHRATSNTHIGGTTDTGEKLQVTGTMRVSGAATFSSSVTAGGRILSGTRAFIEQNGSGDADMGALTGGNLTLFNRGLSVLLFNAGGQAIFNTNLTNGVIIQSGGINVTGAATFSSSVTLSGNLTVDTNTFFVDSNNNRVGIGTTTPGYPLDVQGTARVSSQIDAGSHIDLTGLLYHRNNIAVLNKANTGWVTWATRNTAGAESVVDLSNVGTFTSSGNLTVDTNTFFVDAANNRVGVKQSSPTSSLHVDGSNARSYVTKTANYTMTENDYTILCDTTSGGFTITLPAASGCAGRIYCIKKTVGNSGVNNVTIDGNASETIDGSTTISLQCRSSVIIQSDGSNWWVLAEKNDASCI